MKKAVCLIMFFLLLGGQSFGIQTPSFPVQPSGLRFLESGDVLFISVVSETEDVRLEVRRVVITDGKVDLPILGKVQAEGLSIKEFLEILKGRYAKRLTSPKVSVGWRLF